MDNTVKNNSWNMLYPISAENKNLNVHYIASIYFVHVCVQVNAYKTFWTGR